MITHRYAKEILENYGKGIYLIEFELEETQTRKQEYIALAGYNENLDVFTIFSVKKSSVNWLEQFEEFNVLPDHCNLNDFFIDNCKMLELKWIADV